MQSTVDQVRALWRDLADAPDAFRERLTIVGSDRHRCAPPGWIGLVTIDGATVATGPVEELDRLRDALIEADTSDLVGIVRAVDRLPFKQMLGPARLFYDQLDRLVAPAPDAVIGPLRVDDERVQDVLRDATQDERNECGLADGAEGLRLAVDASGNSAAICGWSIWPHGVAHIGVLAARSHRGGGAARRVASATLDAARAAGLLPQWRAAVSNRASVRLARSLGLAELGSQLSVEP